MIQTIIAINEQDCTMGDGNTPEEYEAMAVTLLRAAEAIRNREEGLVECVNQSGEQLVYVGIHICGPNCDELDQSPTIERFVCMAEPPQSLRGQSLLIIDHYRRGSTRKASSERQ